MKTVMRNSSLPRFLCAALLLAASAMYLRAHSRSEVFPSRLPLQSFPEHLGNLTGTDVPMDGDVLQVLGPGDFLSRVYTGQPQYIHLFIAYFPSQRAGDTIHSPRNCLPGAGWNPVKSSRITLTVSGHTPFPANRYIIAKGDSRQLVLYWYWAHNRGVASEYWAKYYLVADSIRMNRSDGALVRLTTPIAAGESADDAEQRLTPVVNDIVAMLGDYIPR
jgi:EpsI family protein